jgi:hypothetical protein
MFGLPGRGTDSSNSPAQPGLLMAPTLSVEYGLKALHAIVIARVAPRGREPSAAAGAVRLPSDGRSGWFSHTQPQSSQSVHFIVYPDFAGGGCNVVPRCKVCNIAQPPASRSMFQADASGLTMRPARRACSGCTSLKQVIAVVYGLGDGRTAWRSPGEGIAGPPAHMMAF